MKIQKNDLSKIKKSDIAKFFKKHEETVDLFFNTLGKKRDHLLDAKFVRAASPEEAAKHLPKMKSISLHAIFSHNEKEYLLALNSGRNSEALHYRRFYEDDRPVKTISRKYQIEAELKDDIGASDHNSDCQIRALASVLNRSYAEVAEVMIAEGWSQKNIGTLNSKHFKATLAHFSASLRSVFNAEREGVQKMTVNTAAQRFNEGTFIAHSHCHVNAIIDGVIHDSYDSRLKLVKEIFKVSVKEVAKTSAEKPAEAPENKKRVRRTKAQIEAEKLAEIARASNNIIIATIPKSNLKIQK
jgi:hypothetical protein